MSLIVLKNEIREGLVKKTIGIKINSKLFVTKVVAKWKMAHLISISHFSHI